MRFALYVVVAAGMALTLIGASGSVKAQSVDTKALAEQLFDQAREHVKAARWEEACPKFEASLRYDPALGTKLNLATCYERLGKLASAWGLYRESMEQAKKAGEAKRADYAQKQASALEPRLPKLRISVAPPLPPGLVVQRDGIAMDAGAFGVELYVDPGEHHIVASAPGFTTFEQKLTIVEGKTEALDVPPLAVEVVANSPLPRPAQLRAEPEERPAISRPSRKRMYLGLGLGGAGLAAVATGLVFGMNARSNNDEAKELCGADLVCGGTAHARSQQLIDDARSQAKISTATVVAGGVALVAGAVLFITAPRAEKRSSAAQLVPTAQAHGAGLALIGNF